MQLRDVAENSCAHRLLSAYPTKRLARSQVGEGVLIDCSGSFEENVAHIPARTRRNIRRLERRALLRSGVRLSVYRGPEVSHEVIASFMDIENDGWKGTRKTSILSDPTLRGFYDSLVTDFDKHHDCQINILFVAGQEVAAQFGIVSNDVFHVLKIGYRQGFADIGPGNLLLMYAIKDASDVEDISTIKLLTAPSWSRRWASWAERIHAHDIFQPTLAGRTLRQFAKARWFVSRLARRAGLISTARFIREREPYEGEA